VIWFTLSDGSLKIAVFTFVVITLSSMYWPVLDWFDVDAQPSAVSISAMMKNPEKRLSLVMTYLLYID
jgi:fumarate reductase subunit D